MVIFYEVSTTLFMWNKISITISPFTGIKIRFPQGNKKSSFIYVSIKTN